MRSAARLASSSRIEMVIKVLHSFLPHPEAFRRSAPLSLDARIFFFSLSHRSNHNVPLDPFRQIAVSFLPTSLDAYFALFFAVPLRGISLTAPWPVFLDGPA